MCDPKASGVTALEQAQVDLQSLRVDLQRLLSASDSVQENERKRIARELHDDLQQKLAAIKVYVKLIREDMRYTPTQVQPLIASIDGLVTAAMQSVRRIVDDLRPVLIEDSGLMPALDELADQFDRTNGVECSVAEDDDSGGADKVSKTVAACLYRVAQESLNNIAKHAQASVVQIRLSLTPEGLLLMSVSDNGWGMSTADRSKIHSFGILGMRERLHAVGGTLVVESHPGAGTMVSATVPLPDLDQAAVV